jgi:electron transfer flavoprotein alpha subunit
MSVLIFLESDKGVIKNSSLEAIAYGAAVASKVGGEVIALALGDADDSELAKAGHFGATKVLHAADTRLTQENSLAYAEVLAQAVAQTGSEVVVLAKSGIGDAVAARAAVKLKAAVVSGATELPDTGEGVFRVKKGIYSGKAFATVELKTPIKIVAIRKNVIETQAGGQTAPVEQFPTVLEDSSFRAVITGQERASSDVSLSDADIIVSGGRGMKGPENWQPLLDLAAALGAATGCSKPVSDLDWRPHHEHIGQTGIKVAPNLYIACGISGAIQHLAGVNGSRCIVVINKDPEAPFFKAADYGIVGDVFDVLPKLTKAARELL